MVNASPSFANYHCLRSIILLYEPALLTFVYTDETRVVRKLGLGVNPHVLAPQTAQGALRAGMHHHRVIIGRAHASFRHAIWWWEEQRKRSKRKEPITTSWPTRRAYFDGCYSGRICKYRLSAFERRLLRSAGPYTYLPAGPNKLFYAVDERKLISLTIMRRQLWNRQAGGGNEHLGTDGWLSVDFMTTLALWSGVSMEMDFLRDF